MDNRDIETLFKIGDKVITDLTNQEGIIKNIVIRDKEWTNRIKYLVEMKKKGFFGRTKEEWVFEDMLNKLKVQN